VRALVARECRGVGDPIVLRATALDLWRAAQFREERYAATGVTGLRPLRDLARHDPDWVRAFATEHPLSPLSRREALKHFGGA